MILPLEEWASEIHTASMHPTRRDTVGPSSLAPRLWFTASAFFAVASIVRAAPLPRLPSQSLIGLLRALSSVDRYREDVLRESCLR